MFNFVTQLDDLFLHLYLHLVTNIRAESITFVILFALFFIILFLHKKLAGFISHSDWKFKSYGVFLLGLIFPLIYLLIVKHSGGYLKGSIAIILFNSLAYYYLGFYLIKNLLEPLKISYVPWNLLAYILLAITVSFVMLLKLNDLVFDNPEIQDALSLIYKVATILLIYMFLLRGIKILTELLPDKLSLTKTVLESLLGFASILYLMIAALWLFKIIGIASSFFLGAVVIFIAAVSYGLVRAYVGTNLKPKLESEQTPYKGFLKSIDIFLNLLFIYLLYLIFTLFFNLDQITLYISELFLLNTGVIVISLFSLISGVFAFFFLLSIVGILKHAVYFYNIKRGRDVEAGSLRSLVANLGLLVVIMITLSQIGLSWKALLPVAGALGIGLGIGLQNIMNNYISGFILLFSKRLKVGDIIEIDGNAGRAIGNTLDKIYGSVESIDTFSSVVSTTDGIEVVVPNSQFLEQQMVNYSLSNSTIRVRIPFGVSYASDPNKVKEILLKVAGENTQILPSPAPNIWFTEYADSAIVFYLLCWVNIRHIWKINPVISQIYFNAWYQFEKEGIVIPFPQQDVWFKNNLKVEIEKDDSAVTQKESDLWEGKK